MPISTCGMASTHRFLCLAAAFVSCSSQALIPDASALLQSAMSKPMAVESPMEQMQQASVPMQPMFLQPQMQPSYVSAIQMPQFSMPEGNLRGPIEQVPQMMPMSASYQTPLQFAQMMPAYQPAVPTAASFYQQQMALQQQLLNVNKQLKQLKDEEESQAQRLQAKTSEADTADKRLREAESKLKDADAAAKQLQDREQKVEDQAISAVRTAKSQVSQAQKEVKEMQDELRQAQADAIQARAAQAAAEEQVAKSEMLQATQAQTDINNNMLGTLSTVRRSSMEQLPRSDPWVRN